jgi:serine/threonine-protein kinase
LPKPGTTAPVGSDVTILVSSGPAPQAIPSLRGLTYDAASKQLEQDGFVNINPPINETSSSVASGTVIRTDPATGKVVPLDTHINIYVSSGPQTIPMPNEINQPKATAIHDLEAQGFSVSALNRIDDANIGRVVDQRPEPGTQVQQQSAVVLYVGVASSSPTTATTTTSSPTTSSTGP